MLFFCFFFNLTYGVTEKFKNASIQDEKQIFKIYDTLILKSNEDVFLNHKKILIKKIIKSTSTGVKNKI